MAGLVNGNTAGSVVGPLRQINRVPPQEPTFVPRDSSMTVLSRSASTTTAAPRWLTLAATSSLTTVKTCSDHPRTTACLCSSTVERPRRNEVIRSVSAVVIRPTSVET